jgi:hypothetical protein
MKTYEKIILIGMTIRLIGEGIGLYYKISNLLEANND